MAQDMKETCHFTPIINPKSREMADALLISKQAEKIRQVQSARDQVVVDQEEDSETLMAMLEPPSVTTRLAQDAAEALEKRIAVQEYYDTLETQPFAPQISEVSAKLVQEKAEFQLDFVTRQAYFELVEQEKREQLEDQVEQTRNLTFRPNIGNANQILKELRPDRIQENTQQRLYRMIYDTPRQKERQQAHLRTQLEAECTFKPVINPFSKALVKTSKRQAMTVPVKTFRSRVAMEMKEAELAECTFRPTLHTKSHSTSKLLIKEKKGDKMMHSIDKERMKRIEDLNAKRNELELRELEACTFQPDLTKTRSSKRQSPPKTTVRSSFVRRMKD